MSTAMSQGIEPTADVVSLSKKAVAEDKTMRAVNAISCKVRLILLHAGVSIPLLDTLAVRPCNKN